MAHVAKHTKAATGHLLAHYDRSGHNIGNESIDPARTHENYNLGPQRDMSQGDFIRQRCGEVKLQNRKDVNVMCSWVLTKPADLPEADREKFFEAAYNFMADRYGKDNVISAHVHMDEATPHMHFAFVPVVHDDKKNIDKVSAKEAVNRTDLKMFHQDLSAYMKRVFGRDVGVMNEATKDGNKSIDELKRGSAIQEAAELAQNIVKEQKKMESLRVKQEALKGSIAKLDKRYEGRMLQQEKIDAIQPKKTLLGDVVLKLEEFENLKKTASEAAKHKEAATRFKREKEAAETKAAQLEQKVPSMDERLADAEDKVKLQELEAKFNKLPPAVRAALELAERSTGRSEPER